MASNNVKQYNAADFGKKEEALHRLFQLQLEDSRRYFVNVTKPRLDRAYKLYIAYTGDRAKEIKSWQANIFVPYVQSVVETLMPRILDARPEFGVGIASRRSRQMLSRLNGIFACDHYM